MSKEVQKLYKFVVDNLKKFAVKIGIRKETLLEKGSGFISNVYKGVERTVDDLVKKQRNASSKNKDAHSNNKNHRGRN